MNKKTVSVLLALALTLALTACQEKPYGALPSPQQIAWFRAGSALNTLSK